MFRLHETSVVSDQPVHIGKKNCFSGEYGIRPALHEDEVLYYSLKLFKMNVYPRTMTRHGDIGPCMLVSEIDFLAAAEIAFLNIELINQTPNSLNLNAMNFI